MQLLPTQTALWGKEEEHKNLKKKADSDTYFAYRLSMDPENPSYKAAEYLYYDQKYKIGSSKQELPFCVVSTAKNNNNNVGEAYSNIP